MNNRLVILPHEDDELNLVGGLLNSDYIDKSNTYMAYVTNGDYYCKTVTRVKEVTKALKRCSIQKENIIYLGYCDQQFSENTHIYMTDENNEFILLDPENLKNTQININNSDEGYIDIKNTGYYELRNISDVKSIETGAAIITEICYSKKFIGYDLEEKDSLCKKKKQAYTDALNELKDAIKNVGTDRSTLKEKQDACITTYKDYTNTLEEAVLAAERR